MKLHLDTDLGGDPDDVCALALLLAHPGVEVTGITTSHEREGRRAGYVHEVLRLAGREGIPVAAGSDRAFGRRWRVAPSFETEAEYWRPDTQSAPGGVDRMIALLDASIAEGATVVAIGPPTNLALYDAVRPGRLATVPVVLMGGFVVPREGPPIPPGLPQWTPEHDWNLNLDAEATDRVLRNCRPTLVPINVTLRTHLRERDLPRLERAGDLGRLVAHQALVVQRERRAALPAEHPGLPADLANFHHDPLACAVALGWPGARVEELPLSLELPDAYPLERVVDGAPLYPVVTDVDGDAFGRWWLDLVAPGTDG